MQILPVSGYTFEDSVLLIDPCYIFSDEQDQLWQEVVDMMFDENKNVSERGLLQIGSMNLLYIQTRYGDGQYNVSSGGSLGVDAGLICAVEVEQVKNFNPEFENWNWGVIVEKQHIKVENNNMFGETFNIYTDDSDFDDEEDYCYKCDNTGVVEYTDEDDSTYDVDCPYCG